MSKRIALVGENSIEYIRLLLNIWRKHDCAVLIDWRIPLNKSIEIMRGANVKSCYIENNYLNDEFYLENDIEFNSYKVENADASYLPQCNYDLFEPSYSSDDAVIIFSSGTTGFSKGIRLSYYAINTNADAIIEYMNPEKSDCIYITKALSHSSTLVGELLVGLKTKTKLLISHTVILPRAIVKNILSYNVTILCVNPTILTFLINAWYNNVNNKGTSLRVIYTSGSIINESLMKKARESFKGIDIYNVYGLTEAGPRVAAQTKSHHHKNSVGLPIKGVSIKVVLPTGKMAKRNEIGNVYVKTNSIFNGYLDDSIDTNIKNGWIDTKDLGYVDGEGELFIIGRSDDVIISGSHNINPFSIEETISSFKGIEECIVFGIPDKILGEKIVCEYIANEPFDLVELIQYCENKLSSYEIPRKWIKVNNIEKNLNGKVDRKSIKKKIVSKKGDQLDH